MKKPQKRPSTSSTPRASKALSSPVIDPDRLRRLTADGERALAQTSVQRAIRERQRRQQARDERANEALMFTQAARMRRDVGVSQGTYRAYVFEQPANRMVRACSHKHRTYDAAIRCAEEMTTDIRGERGITARRMRVEEVTPAQSRARLAYRVGLAVSVIVRRLANEVLREHEGHDVRRVIDSSIDDGVLIYCEDCDQTYTVGVSIREE